MAQLQEIYYLKEKKGSGYWYHFFTDEKSAYAWCMGERLDPKLIQSTKFDSRGHLFIW